MCSGNRMDQGSTLKTIRIIAEKIIAVDGTQMASMQPFF